MFESFDCEPYKTLLRKLAKNDPNSFVITFCGHFNTGKSTLLNTILKTDILPSKSTTATAVVTRIRYGERTGAYVVENGVSKKISIKGAQERILFKRDYKIEKVRNTEIIFEIPSPLLRDNVEFVDTPGIDDSDCEGVSEISMEYAKNSSLCIMVLSALQFFGTAEEAMCREINAAIGGNILFAANKIDLIHAKRDYDSLLEIEKNRLKSFGNAIIGRGKCFNTAICDKEKELDGLDAYIGHLIERSRQQAAQTARTARRRAMYEELLIQLRADSRQLEAALKAHKAQAQRYSDGEKHIKSVAQIQLDSLILRLESSYKSKITDSAAIMSRIRLISPTAEYADKSKAAVMDYYTSVQEAMRSEFDSEMANIKMIDPAVSRYVSFPGASLRSCCDELPFPGPKFEGGNKEVIAKVIGGAVGIGLGLLFGGGFAAGPLAVAGAKAATEFVDDPIIDVSPSNTGAYISNNVYANAKSIFYSIIDSLTAGADEYKAAPLPESNLDEKIAVEENRLLQLKTMTAKAEKELKA